MSTAVTVPAIAVAGVSKRFRLYSERNQSLKSALLRRGRSKFDDFWALRDVSLDVPQGSTFGLIGSNGSGKSTLLKCMARILQPNDGTIEHHGSLGALLELGSGFHPELSGRENIYLNASILGLTRREIERRYDDIVQFSGVEEFIDQPVKNYSSGMYVRLGFSVAINIEPDILLVDEILAVGDAAFQARCLDKFADYRRAGRTVVLVSHDAGTVKTICDAAAWLDHGRLQRVGPAAAVVDEYLGATTTTRIELPGGGTRDGTGEIRVEEVSISAPDDRGLVAGEPFTVSVWLRSSEPIDRPVIGLGLETRQGVVAWGTNTLEAGLRTGKLDGSARVDFHCPKLPLQGQSFDLLVAVTDNTTHHVYDFLRQAVRVDIAPASPAESGGHVILQGQWRLSPGEEPRTTTFAPVSDTAAPVGATPVVTEGDAIRSHQSSQERART